MLKDLEVTLPCHLMACGLSLVHGIVLQYCRSSWVPVYSRCAGKDYSDDFSVKSVGMAANGMRIICGTEYLGRGKISVFQDDGISSWVKVNSSISGRVRGDYFGWAVGISDDGSRIIAGASNSDKVVVYDQVGSSWVLVNAIIQGAAGERFGYSVGISGDGTRIVAGAYRSSKGNRSHLSSGAVAVYQDDTENSSWVPVNNKRIPGKAKYDYFGYPVDYIFQRIPNCCWCN